MELSVNGRQRRAAQVSKAAPQAEKKPAGAGVGSVKPRTDKAAWSQAALSFLQEVNRQDMERQRKLLEARQRNSGDLEMLSKSLKTMEKCRIIASRIMKGDKVPPQDEQFLMEADPDGYKLAIACRAPKEKPKEWESVLEEEREGSDSGGETAETVESGGEAAEC
ncbi:hypothetical protein [uncultured Oscillibacter sp.]|mgnify:FL=1|jgi:hypothetical protein|uniref:hypothetical protein n=1 Tax=uncultured Oscillibacter sp. TaxID=876091 RepID=UPI0021739D49|nr:hypothetical protein [uncultured Oscillibacter sp.]MCI9554267.1 hypothetical protein [Oscillibacter sp.]